MSQNSKATRTQIADLPETSVEMSEQELQLVSGGLLSNALRLSSSVALLRYIPTEPNRIWSFRF